MSVQARGESAIRARAVRKVYGAGPWARKGHLALAGVDLVVPFGSVFGLVGLNGAGKTTFVKALLGVVSPSAGELEVLGGSPGDVAVRARIGYVPERLALPAAWTARAYLRSVARLKRLARGDADITRQLGRVGLAKEAERRIGQFSKGMRQRLALAVALLGSPELLVLDEPTDGVDPLGRAEIRQLLAEERARGATLLLNSHLLSETERMCDRIAILSSGTIVREGSVRELCGAEGTWSARFEGPAPAGIRGFEAQTDGSYLVAAGDARELDARLAEARARGALLVDLRPHTRDLETVLAEALRR